MNTRKRRIRGSALIAVITMFMLIAAAVTSLMLVFATENQRTRAAASGAQLRQLLLAAQVFSADELRLHGPAAREINVAPPIPVSNLTLSISPHGNQQVQIHVLAKLPHTSASQMLIYSPTDSGAWRLESAILGNEP